MAIVNTHYGFCAKGGAAVKFTYTGDYNVRADGVVELLTSGTIVFLAPAIIDIFCVGGGGAGNSGKSTDPATSNIGYGGGGGGYTRTVRSVNVAANTSIPVTIGAGGIPFLLGGSGAGVSGGETTFGTFASAKGGKGKQSVDEQTSRVFGNNGGSGGGGGVKSNSDYGAGGYDGNEGESGYPTSNQGGTGQQYTTREFGEAGGKLYAGGGGGGRYMVNATPIVSPGGSGGGGSGAWAGASNDLTQAAEAGVANTGGGGGGGASRTWNSRVLPASGGSGIVCFRKALDLPELAGTWVLNERLYAPENAVYFNNQQFKSGDATNPNRGTGINLSCTTSKIWYTSYPSGYDVTVYTFSSNSWGSDKHNYITFPAGATASDEFRAWLASNATKQS